jgi:hypothetical protein
VRYAGTRCRLHSGDQPDRRIFPCAATKRQHVVQVGKGKATIRRTVFGENGQFFPPVAHRNAFQFQP